MTASPPSECPIDDRPFGAGAIGGGGLVGERLPLGVIVHGRIDAVALNLFRKRIHAERENVHQPAQHVNVGARLRHAWADAQPGDHQDRQHPDRRQSPHISHCRLCRLLAFGPGASPRNPLLLNWYSKESSPHRQCDRAIFPPKRASQRNVRKPVAKMTRCGSSTINRSKERRARSAAYRTDTPRQRL